MRGLSMTDRPIPEMQAEHSERASEILSGYHAEIDQIKAEREPTEGAYLDRLEPEQRSTLLQEQKHSRAASAHETAYSEYSEEVGRYHEALQERTSWLKGRLFKVEGPDGAAALSRTVTATEGELSAFLDVAIQAENAELARAVFVAAERRGSGDLIARYFDEVDKEARDLYQEFRKAPSAEVLERQVEGIGRILPQPEPGTLDATARVGY